MHSPLPSRVSLREDKVRSWLSNEVSYSSSGERFWCWSRPAVAPSGRHKLESSLGGSEAESPAGVERMLSAISTSAADVAAASRVAARMR